MSVSKKKGEEQVFNACLLFHGKIANQINNVLNKKQQCTTSLLTEVFKILEQ